MATARLGSGTASSSNWLRGDSSWAAPTSASVGAAPSDATYIVQTASSGLSAEQALGVLATGLLKNTTTTGVLSIAAAGDLPDHASRHANGGADEVALDASQITSGTMATARLGSGTASASNWLRGDSSWAAPTAASMNAAPDDAKYIVQTASSGLSAEQALSSLSTGVMKVTTTTGVVSSMTGTSGRMTEWSDGTTIGASTLIKSGAGVLTLSASTTETLTVSDGGTLSLGGFTLTLPATGTVALGTGTANQIAYWSGTNTIAADTDLRFDGTYMSLGTSINSAYRLLINGTGTGSTTYGLTVRNSSNTNTLYVRDDGRGYFAEILGCDRISTVFGVSYDLRSYTADADATSIGYVDIEVGGVVRKFMIRA